MAKSKQLVKGNNLAVRPSEIVEARFNLTAKENDILDFVLSKLEDDDTHKYILQVDDFKNIYKTDTSNTYRDLKKASLSIYNKGFKLINDRSEAHFHWFSAIEFIEKDSTIICELGQTLKEILLNMKKKIYYKIDYSMNLSSVYSKRIYYYLLNFLDEKKDYGWRVDKLDKLREKMQCPESYKNFYDFKRYVLDIAEKEINKITDLTFTYEQIYTKNKVTSIKFLIERKEKRETPKQQQQQIEPPVQKITYEFVQMQKIVGNCSEKYIEMLELFASKEITIEDFKNIAEAVKDNKKLEQIYSRIKEQLQSKNNSQIVAEFYSEINKLQLVEEQKELIAQVKQIIKEPITNKDILKILETANNDIKLIANKYKLTKNKKVNNLVGFLIKAIEEDYTTTRSEVVATIEPKQNKFNNYQQREYDFEELERQDREKLRKKQYKIN